MVGDVSIAGPLEVEGELPGSAGGEGCGVHGPPDVDGECECTAAVPGALDYAGSGGVAAVELGAGECA